MSSEKQQIEAGIIALEAQRALLGDVVVDTALAPLRAKLAVLAAFPADDEPPAQTLKQITILFLDIVDSVNLIQRLDPEQASEVMDGALAAFAAIAEAHGGKVLRYAGDNMLAVFGADESREDDPERAVRAGLALLEAGRAQGAMVKQTHFHDGFDVRVGIHTGGVLLGGGVDGGCSIHGHAVNIAARMEQTASPGTLRISHGTYRHVRGVFTVATQPPLFIKGVDDPVTTYLVHRAKPRAFRVASRGIEGVETRMIGRDAELEELQNAFHALYRDRRLAAVIVVAEAGHGKSRLLDEFRNWAETRPERFKVFNGRATPQTQSQPYGMLRDVVAWRLQIADTDSMATARKKIETGISPLFETDDGPDMSHAHLLGQLVGIDFSASPHVRGMTDDPRQIRNRGFHAAAEMFRRLAARDGDPIILHLDDLQWADNASLDFLNYLAQVNRDVPMLVVSATRPTLFERRRDWSSIQGIHRRIELEPLDRRASRELALELLKKLPGIPAALRELITGGAEGNPFYMEELVKMLVDQGAIETGAERWTLHADRLMATKVPATLTGVLQARLDGLPAAERLALQQASVIGLVFWDAALAALDARAPEALPSLVRRELTLPRAGTALDGVREFAFRHHILHQVTYGTLLRRMRRDLHARAAAWLTGLTGARAADFLSATAEHYEQAGDPANACEFFARAAEQARDRLAHDAALASVTRALALLGEDIASGQHVLRWRLLYVREATLDLLGNRAEQLADIDALDALAEALDDDLRRAEVAYRRGVLAMRTDDFGTEERAARRAMVLAARAGDEALRLRAQTLLGSALLYLGDITASKALALEGLAAARARGEGSNEALFLNVLAVAAFHEGDLTGYLDFAQQYLVVAREQSQERPKSIALGNLGLAWLRLGDHAQARAMLEDALRATRAMRDRASEPNALCALAQLALREGDDALALTHAQAALDVAVEVRARRYEARALWFLGNAELALGRHAAAQTAFERCCTVALAIGHTLLHNGKAGLARVALEQGDVAGAMRDITDVLDHLASGGMLAGAEEPRLIQLICYQVLGRAGDSRAAAMLASTHTAIQTAAATIADPELRQSYLTNIPEHREIITARVRT
jgi:class 3 adenylate cyclase